ncbi:MAG: N-acyl homoserine lactonase family protein [Oscillospiraceae bacterium]|nr:N-acyl homoserine lactonase family protein [Oscillospiraceae bacterium]
MKHKLEVYLLDLGSLHAKRESIVCRGHEEDLSRMDLPVMAVLIRHREGVLLFDTGCRPDAMEGGWPDNMQQAFPLTRSAGQALERQLSLCGVSPDQVDTVVLSHLHLDHAGNGRLFPHARLIVPAADYPMACRSVCEEEPTRRGGYIRQDLEELPAKVVQIGRDTQLFPGVRLLWLPGHTPGLLGMMISGGGKTILFPSDAVYTAANYGPPPLSPRSPYDKALLLQSMERVRKLQKEFGAQVIFSHDIETWKTLPKAPQPLFAE